MVMWSSVASVCCVRCMAYGVRMPSVQCTLISVHLLRAR